MNENLLIPLSRAAKGQQVCVRDIQLDGGIHRRLLDLGLIEGTVITPLQQSPSGDPTAYFIRGTVIALRRQDAQCILVEPVAISCLSAVSKEVLPHGETAANRRAGG